MRTPEQILAAVKAGEIPDWEEITDALDRAIARIPAADRPKESPFDKVLLVAQIAALEATVEHERVAKVQAMQSAAHLAKALKQQTKRTFTAMNFPLEKIPLLVQSVRPWLKQENLDAFDQLVTDAGFGTALGIGVRALFLEVLGDEEAGPNEAKDDHGS